MATSLAFRDGDDRRLMSPLASAIAHAIAERKEADALAAD
jgi:hypothetical protein